MRNSTINRWLADCYLTRSNCSYIEQLYEKFLVNPEDVDIHWSNLFKKITLIKRNLNTRSTRNYETLHNNLNHITSDEIINYNNKYMKISKLIHDFRMYGHQHVKLDPLGLWKQSITNNLNLTNYKFDVHELQEIFEIKHVAFNQKRMKLIDLYYALKDTYCNYLGIEYMHISNIEEIYWIQRYIESIDSQNILNITEKKLLFNELIEAETIEHYLSKKFPNSKRFSLEGADVLIPMLKEIIRIASEKKMKRIVLGMAHRGRLNVLINIFGKQPRDLFKEFQEIDNNYEINSLSDVNSISGDVKYHQGFFSDIEIDINHMLHLSLMFNPSHLEIINPVVMGVTRAYIDKENDNYKILPITIHGDAAISGQGVMQETLNMSKVRAYDVGGTIRIIINNQIGFTNSSIEDSRSTEYCTDITKILQVPVFHVNADNPEATILAIRMAYDFRNNFKKDVIIDLVCYRRHGHNEVDDPSATQPIMYHNIRQHPTVVQIYLNKLKNKNIINDADYSKIISSFINKIDQGDCVVKNIKSTCPVNKIYTRDSLEYLYNTYYNEINIQCLKELAISISDIPPNIIVHPRVEKIYQERKKMSLGEIPFNWGGAEMLSYASLLNQGISIRLSGEDTKRGTFFHRHAVIYDQIKNEPYIPLNHISNCKGNFQVWDSVLTEEAVLAFEFGYSSASINNGILVIWEAQFGDFANGAQIVMDQFISASEQKWNQLCNLVMLLPHGYEGQGPEHSSARLERYLQLCAEENMQVCIPSTPSQIYHLLRRQILCNIFKPLIILSPKSLLRHPMVLSSLKELALNKFKTIIDEVDNFIKDDIIQIIFCSGKIYYDLLSKRRKNQQTNIAIIRIEQLYPFPIVELKKTISIYLNVNKFIWCQEEPKNQGAWNYCKIYLNKIIIGDIIYVGRAASAAPASGYFSIHQIQQKKIIDDALNVN